MPTAAAEGPGRLRRGRFGRAGLLVVLLLAHGALIALMMRSGVVPVPPAAERLILFDVVTPPPPPEPPPEPEPEPAAAAAAPPARAARPRPTPPAPRPQPAPAAEPGPDPASGAADRGPGSGLAGPGDGAGAGGHGSGTGAGGRARWLSGAISPRDYPREASRTGVGGSVTVVLDVDADGRVTACRVTGSSGHPALDETTCRLIRERFRYRPATDAAGNPVPGRAAWRQDWWLEPRRGGIRAPDGS